MYSIYKCKDTLNKINLTHSKGLKCVIFSQELKAVMKIDVDLCNSLMVMYNKFLEPKQNLSDLKSLVLCSSNLINRALECYGKLIKKNPQSKLVLELFGLLLIDILNDRKLGYACYNKEKGKGTARQGTFQRSHQQLNEKNWIFIVSGNSRDLGKFLYASRLALDLLKIPKNRLTSTYIFEFIPEPLLRLHKGYLENFADKCLTHTIPCNVFPFLLINGYLVECTSATECVVYEQNTHFVTFLDPVVILGREVLFIDRDGVIISHSAGLCSIFEVQSNHVEGTNINDYLPVDYSSLTPGIPVKLKLTLALEFSIKYKLVEVFLNPSHTSGKYFTLYITTEADEIGEWCKQELETMVNLDHIELLNSITIKKSRINENTENFELQMLEEEDKHENSSPSSSSHLQDTKENKSLIVSLRSLRAINLLLLFSVTTNQIISLIAAVLSSSVVLYELSMQLNDLSIIQHLGELNYWLLILAIIIREDDVSMITSTPLFIPISSIQSVLGNISESYVQLGNDGSNWPSCPGTYIAAEKAIPCWKLVESAPTLGYLSLQDYVGETLRIVRYI